MAYLMQQKAYEPAALAVISFALTWASMGIIQFVGRGVPGQTQVAAGH
jgi:putative spermidine/putrescine transport system permease protein